MVKINQVSFTYSNRTEYGVTNISLNLPAGECILLCGRSGCGKTTVTRLINGLIPHFFKGKLSGQISINGMDVSATPMYQTAGYVGSVFQNPRTQFFNVDTDSEIAFGIENAALPPSELRRRVADTADKLNIQPLLGKSIFKLSGGEKQKIAFAGIYAMNPDVYLLDEPSANLDAGSVEALKNYLRLIKQQGKTIIIAEHRLYYLMELADRIVYLEDGKINGIYSASGLLQIPQEERERMGLRTLDLNDIHPVKNTGAGTSALLELKDVTLRYKKRIILEHIHLAATPGEIIAVTGQNGVGKTTFSRAICGLHKEQDGQFFWSGKRQSHKDLMARSYMVMQDVNYQLFADSVEAECCLGIRNTDRTHLEQTLSELKLHPFRNTHPNTLSGGQKQRVAVAVSMMCGKEVLIFDEPTSGLDYDSMTQVAGLIKKLANMSKIIFIVTHDYELICRVCTRILHFNNGVLAEDLLVSPEYEAIIRNGLR